ncbi:NitT/TauT family transport system ATP-binding protein [Microbacteriaceae bacterium SG_E_30_P1]|uniref:NitT/TauT family transport system ATP-binding protein n=1 Tax=Antiquaquibacter oligotrophicus TaxID=2880260 RepID=A0ABT6KM22_9MICO|nr:ABC transporter ATP-binding protein [Antiquaquibacter oligotrophicus]MDH6181066.1 NitT/TauT family transport system ATP-binding protein [Antiquaquibacter oligotrophicus]UDF13236.1 ABC transporter ATP-binding protein [Antiquaquibacter oligotrophicus]
MSTGTAPTVTLDSVGMDFPVGRTTFTALDGVSLSLPERGFTTLLGPSGCGKSTLLRIIADVIQPTRGSVDLFGMTPHQARTSGLFGFVFQDPVLLPWRSALGNVELPLEAQGVSKSERRERAMEQLRLVGLDGFENHLPAKLSGGMARRVAIARALVVQPSILFLDEPFNGLDELRRRQMNVELQRIWSASGTTALLVTHNVAEAVFLSDTVVVMGRNPGHILTERTIDLPRPRNIDDALSPEFIAHERALTDLLSAHEAGIDDTGTSDG